MMSNLLKFCAANMSAFMFFMSCGSSINAIEVKNSERNMLVNASQLTTDAKSTSIIKILGGLVTIAAVGMVTLVCIPSTRRWIFGNKLQKKFVPSKPKLDADDSKPETAQVAEDVSGPILDQVKKPSKSESFDVSQEKCSDLMYYRISYKNPTNILEGAKAQFDYLVAHGCQSPLYLCGYVLKTDNGNHLYYNYCLKFENDGGELKITRELCDVYYENEMNVSYRNNIVSFRGICGDYQKQLFKLGRGDWDNIYLRFYEQNPNLLINNEQTANVFRGKQGNLITPSSGASVFADIEKLTVSQEKRQQYFVNKFDKLMVRIVSELAIFGQGHDFAEEDTEMGVTYHIQIIDEDYNTKIVRIYNLAKKDRLGKLSSPITLRLYKGQDDTWFVRMCDVIGNRELDLTEQIKSKAYRYIAQDDQENFICDLVLM